MVTSAERWKGLSIIMGIIFIFLSCVFILLASFARSFAILAAISLLGILLSMFIWLIAEGIDIGVGSGLIGWLRKYWNDMMGRESE